MSFQNIKAALKTGGFGPMGHGPLPTDDLTPPTRDSVFLTQLQQADPSALNANSLLVGKICETTQYANSVFSTLRKTGVIDAAGHPDTTKIDRHLVSKIGIISVPKQRELVNMLFWWEEELTRWRVLDQEKEEIEAVLGQGERWRSGAVEVEDDEVSNDAGLRERLTVLERLKRVVPSMRGPDGKVKAETEGQGEGGAGKAVGMGAPPPYEE